MSSNRSEITARQTTACKILICEEFIGSQNQSSWLISKSYFPNMGIVCIQIICDI